MITFTGSTATGRAILAAGAPTVKNTLLELGGQVIAHRARRRGFQLSHAEMAANDGVRDVRPELHPAGRIPWCRAAGTTRHRDFKP